MKAADLRQRHSGLLNDIDSDEIDDPPPVQFCTICGSPWKK
jgi:hypothetical protein